MSDDPLQTPVQFVSGVGPDRAELLRKLRLQTVEDILWYLPRDVLDLTEIRAVDDLTKDEVQTVRGVVIDRDARQLSRGRTLSAVLLDCDGQQLRGVWFNQSWVLHKFQDGDVVLFSGKAKRKSGRWEMSHPRTQWLEDDDSQTHGGVLPQYGLTDGLKMHQMRQIARTAAEEYAKFVPERLPEAIRKKHELPTIVDALTGLHLPSEMAQYESSRHRLIFEDLLEFQLALALRRRSRKRLDHAPVLPTTAKIDARIRRLFPFQFTAGQDQAVLEIIDDLASRHSMHRLLQADVGAGKTAVALYIMLVTVAAGYQAVLMAPTELLASQHWATIDRLLANSRVNRLLLTGTLTAAQRRKAIAGISNGEHQLIIGTQAIIQQDVEFQKLGLVIIDEQHKFGVEQRAHFSTGDESPHVLVMTATPIPRSLCLTQFGDLDITVISEMPPGRQRVVTSRIYSAQTRKRAWDFVRKSLREGRQAYVVCPRIEENLEDSTSEFAGSAEEVFRRLSTDELKDFNVGLIHGQLDRQQKADVMESFRQGKIQALVSTTVVEVGVDVPNATLMIIQQAERFGLSQLHQLRGRIARGEFQGYCFLFSNATSEEATKRLSALESTSDGFKISEVDFEIRGPGDVLGTRQHGELPLRVADLLRDEGTLIESRKTAFDLVESGRIDEPEFSSLKIHVFERFGKLMDLSKSG